MWKFLDTRAYKLHLLNEQAKIGGAFHSAIVYVYCLPSTPVEYIHFTLTNGSLTSAMLVVSVANILEC